MAMDLLNNPAFAMAMAAGQNLGNPYGQQVDPMEAYANSVMMNARLNQMRRAQEQNEDLMRMRQEQHAQRMRTGGASFGTVNPRDFTAESLERFRQTGNYQDLERYQPGFTVGGVRYTEQPDGTIAATVPMDQATANAALLSGGVAGAQQAAKSFEQNREQFLSSESRLLSSLDAAKTSNQVVQETIDELRPLLNAATTSYGGLIRGLPGTDAKRVANLLSTIQSNVAFSTLQDMRASSPTGGALGAISAPELELLISNLGSLDQTGSAEDIARVLDRIEWMNASTVERMERAYEMDRARYYGRQAEESYGAGVEAGAELVDEVTPPPDDPTVRIKGD